MGRNVITVFACFLTFVVWRCGGSPTEPEPVLALSQQALTFDAAGP